MKGGENRAITGQEGNIEKHKGWQGRKWNKNEKKKKQKETKISKRVEYKRTCLASWQAFSGEFRIS